VGMKLKECNCLNKMYLFVGVLYALLLFADPGRETYIVQDEPSVTGERHNVYAVVVEILLLMVILALLAHDMKKELIKKCASSFDCIAIAAFCATCQMSVIGELYVTNELTAVYLTVHGIHSCLMTILHFFVASMDSWCCTLWTRLACLMLFAGCLTFFYVKYRFIHIWSEWETCLSPSGCTSFQELYLGAMFNEWVFALKLLVPYCQGRSYAVFKSPVVDVKRCDAGMNDWMGRRLPSIICHKNTDRSLTSQLSNSEVVAKPEIQDAVSIGELKTEPSFTDIKSDFTVQCEARQYARCPPVKCEETDRCANHVHAGSQLHFGRCAGEASTRSIRTRNSREMDGVIRPTSPRFAEERDPTCEDELCGADDLQGSQCPVFCTPYIWEVPAQPLTVPPHHSSVHWDENLDEMQEGVMLKPMHGQFHVRTY